MKEKNRGRLWVEGILPEEAGISFTDCFGSDYRDLLLAVRWPDASSIHTVQGLRIRRKVTGIPEIDASMALGVPLDGQWHWRPDIGGDNFEVVAWRLLPDKNDSAWIPCAKKLPEEDKHIRWYKEASLACTTVLALGEKSPGWPAEVKMANRLNIKKTGVAALDEQATDGWVWGKGLSVIWAWMPLPEYNKQK